MLVPHSAFILLFGCFPFSPCSRLKVKKQSNQGTICCFTFSRVLSISLPTEHKNPPAIFHLLTIETTYQPCSCVYMRGVPVFFQQNKMLLMILKKSQGAETKQTLVPNAVLHKHTTKDISWEFSHDRKNKLYIIYWFLRESSGFLSKQLRGLSNHN